MHFYLFILLFKIFACTGSSLLLMGFLHLPQVGATFCCGVRASCCGGFTCCGAWAPGCVGLSSRRTWAQYLQPKCPTVFKFQQLWSMDLVPHGMWDLPGRGI